MNIQISMCHSALSFYQNDIEFALEKNFFSDNVKVVGIRPMAPVLNTGPLEGIQMLSFLVRKRII